MAATSVKGTDPAAIEAEVNVAFLFIWGRQMTRDTSKPKCRKPKSPRWLVHSSLGAAMALLGCVPEAAYADEGGVSYWLPGRFGSLAAVPGVPGWSMAAV
jgi:hypothetical protein